MRRREGGAAATAREEEEGTLAASLVAVRFVLGGGARGDAGGEQQQTWRALLPPSLSVYAVMGLVGRRFGLAPWRTRLVWRSGVAEGSAAGAAAGGAKMGADADEDDGEWDSEDDSGDGKDAAGWREGGARLEVEITPGTRRFAGWIEWEVGREVDVYVYVEGVGKG